MFLRIVVVLVFKKETANVKENWEEREMWGGYKYVVQRTDIPENTIGPNSKHFIISVLPFSVPLHIQRTRIKMDCVC